MRRYFSFNHDLTLYALTKPYHSPFCVKSKSSLRFAQENWWPVTKILQAVITKLCILTKFELQATVRLVRMAWRPPSLGEAQPWVTPGEAKRNLGWSPPKPEPWRGDTKALIWKNLSPKLRICSIVALYPKKRKPFLFSSWDSFLLKHNHAECIYSIF